LVVTPVHLDGMRAALTRACACLLVVEQTAGEGIHMSQTIKSRAVLQYILFFLINLYTVQVSLANYKKIAWGEFDSSILPVARSIPATSANPSATGSPAHELSTDVIMVARTEQGLLTQRLNNEEIALLKRLANKIGRNDFNKLLASHRQNKDELMAAARLGLRDLDLASK
jgi:hypothetical protein